MQITVTSCVLGGHALRCGNSYVNAIKKELPDAEAQESPSMSLFDFGHGCR